MKTANILFIFTLVLALSCKGKKENLGYIAASTTEFKERITKDKGIILDVRPKEMYPEGHIENAISLDFGDKTFQDDLERINKKTPIYVYCNAGHRSRKTAVLLDEMGFETIVELKNGLDDWKAQKFPIKTGSSQMELPQEVILLASAKQFKEKTHGKEVQLIDIRTPKEYNDGHLLKAKNINFNDGDFLSKMNTLNKENPIYIYCRSGGRSGRAAKKLKEQGFKNIVDLDGGIMSWKSNGFEIEN